MVPGRANVRSPRPPAASAPASTPGSDRYASGGGRPGAPSPPGASDGRSGASRAAGGGRLDTGRGAPRDTSGPAPAWLFSASPRSPLTPSNLPLFWRGVPLPPLSLRGLSLCLSLPFQVSGGLLSRPRQEAVEKRNDLAAGRPRALLSCPSSLWEPGRLRWLLWGQGQGQWGPSWSAKEALGCKT